MNWSDNSTIMQQQNEVQQFDKDDPVEYHGMEGLVNFVCEQYITITTKRGPHKSQDTNVVVFRQFWDRVHPLSL
jgi:hypothetical protein